MFKASGVWKNQKERTGLFGVQEKKAQYSSTKNLEQWKKKAS